MRTLLSKLQSAIHRVEDHVIRPDTAADSGSNDRDSLLQLLGSVHLAAEQMEAAVNQRSASVTSDIHMQQAAEDVRYFKLSQDDLMVKLAAAPVRKRSRKCRSVYGSNNSNREALLGQFGTDESVSHVSGFGESHHTSEHESEELIGKGSNRDSAPHSDVEPPTPRGQGPSEDFNADTPLAAIALAELCGRAVVGSPVRTRGERAVANAADVAPKRKREQPSGNPPFRLHVSPPCHEGEDEQAAPKPDIALVGAKHCNCKKSRCLKLYCDCFSAGRFCDACACRSCQNTQGNTEQVTAVRRHILARSPNAFAVKVLKGEGHRKGCRCRKSKCLKKYCECYQANVRCTDACRCDECQNIGAGCPKDDHPEHSLSSGQPLPRKALQPHLREPPPQQHSVLVQKRMAQGQQDIIQSQVQSLPILPLFAHLSTALHDEQLSQTKAASETKLLPTELTPSSVLMLTTQEEQSTKTGQAFGSPDIHSGIQVESRAHALPDACPPRLPSDHPAEACHPESRQTNVNRMSNKPRHQPAQNKGSDAGSFPTSAATEALHPVSNSIKHHADDAHTSAQTDTEAHHLLDDAISPPTLRVSQQRSASRALPPMKLSAMEMADSLSLPHSGLWVSDGGCNKHAPIPQQCRL